ncbi:MAG: twin-arginine translocation signal domain-containing protein, partial [Kordiimonadaceae bacterium]|nr:twin-arginine translocation signal domain-containing protein [Kordiimonadaceae bacterium]
MLIKNKKNWFESENDVTSESLYLNRRSFMRGAAGVAGATGLIGMGLGSSAMAAGKKRDLALLDFSKSSYDPG